MKPSYRQGQILASLALDPRTFICRHGYAFRRADDRGNYLQCLSNRTVNAMQKAGWIEHHHGCPIKTRREHTDHWVITDAGRMVIA